MNTINRTLSISILSGKGGVGKTTLALNLGYALYNLGRSLMIMDCDLGLANLDVLLGVSPDRNLKDLLDPDVRARDVLYSIEPKGFDFLPAASGVPELVEMDEDLRILLMQKLNTIFKNYNFLVLDLGAGISSTVLSFAAMTQKRIIVLTPEPTSLTDSYALIKVLSKHYGTTDYSILVNQVTSREEGNQTYSRIKVACERFLNISPSLLGYVRQDRAVPESVRKQMPFLKLSAKTKASLDVLSMAKKIDQMREDSLAKIANEPVLENVIDTLEE